ncbi:hypothetical protein H4Q26_003986 [Puccinia striiformis f. sp. tritici PST-130]|nr:hypothetical protein H4Q26_003986 [Puccinia striiformis f. sp. tritici PST-130]
MMMLWFFQEVFNPQYGIPILGGEYIQNWINAQFGPVQIWLMKLLQGKQSTHTTSVAISATWFKKTAPEQWQMRFKDDSCFGNLSMLCSIQTYTPLKNNCASYQNLIRHLQNSFINHLRIQEYGIWVSETSRLDPDLAIFK